MKLRAALAASNELAHAFDLQANSLVFVATDRARYSAALLDQAHEHHKALLLLLEQGMTGSAFAMVRVLFETTIRGLWLFRCASDADVRHFATDPKDLRIGPMIKAVEALYGKDGGILHKVMKRLLPGLNSYAHSGYLQVVRRITSEHITPSYADEEQLAAVAFADFCFFLAAVEILNLANRPELAAIWAQKFNANIPAP